MIRSEDLESSIAFKELIDAVLQETLREALERYDREFDEWLLYGDRGKDG